MVGAPLKPTGLSVGVNDEKMVSAQALAGNPLGLFNHLI
jgi:hypothetical protein